ncbi:hypothetical protein ACF06X_34455 [Streptomyces sp. NPDC015346]|uniref:hypothetical protein n=1 Tax=Streptomyces sp. NPDC015346 TaxID=3364954 RepID=UPI0036F7E85C
MRRTVMAKRCVAVQSPPSRSFDFSKDLPGETTDKAYGMRGAVRGTAGTQIGGAVLSRTDVSGEAGEIVYRNGLIGLYNHGSVTPSGRHPGHSRPPHGA